MAVQFLTDALNHRAGVPSGPVGHDPRVVAFMRAAASGLNHRAGVPSGPPGIDPRIGAFAAGVGQVNSQLGRAIAPPSAPGFFGAHPSSMSAPNQTTVRAANNARNTGLEGFRNFTSGVGRVMGPGEIEGRRDDETKAEYYLGAAGGAALRAPANAFQALIGQDSDDANLVRGVRDFFTVTPNSQRAAHIKSTVKSNFASERPSPFAGARTSSNVSRQAQVAAGGFPNSYKDPLYDELEEQASKMTGVPKHLMSAIRLAGERSNNDQVSSAGARTPYQFIPSTRDAFMKKYGVDAWRDPASAALATALHLKENLAAAGGDPVVAAQMFHGGVKGVNAGPINRQYGSNIASFLGGMSQDLMGGMQPGFDPSPYQGVAQMFGPELEAALMRPQTATMDMGPAPEMQPLVQAAPTDFSASDAALKKLDPSAQAPNPAQKKRLQWQGIFAGLGQSLMAMPEGAGLGKTLAMIGGGILAGRGKGDQMFEAEMDKFQDKVDSYNKLIANNEYGKAQIKHQEAVQQAGAINDWNYKDFSNKLGQWSRSVKMDVDADGITTQQLSPDGRMTVTRMPSEAAVKLRMAQLRAGPAMAMAEGYNADLARRTGLVNGVTVRMGAAAGMQAMMGGDTSTEALTTGIAPMAGMAMDIVESGDLGSIFDEATVKQINKRVQQEILARSSVNQLSGQDSLALQQRFLSNIIVQYATEKAAQGPEGEAWVRRFWETGQRAAALRAVSDARSAKRTETRRSGPNGTTSTVSTIFGGE